MRQRRRVMRQVAAVLAVVAFAVAGCGGKPGASSADAFADGTVLAQVYPVAGRVTPGPVSGELLDGTAFDLAALRGQVVVVNWWGSWCAPCRAEAPHLVSAYDGSRDLNVAFVGVDVRDEHDAANAFVEGFHIPYPSLFDPSGRVALQFAQVNPNVVPTTVILDRSGHIAAIFRKALRSGELDPVILQIATENGEPVPPGHVAPSPSQPATTEPDASATASGGVS